MSFLQKSQPIRLNAYPALEIHACRFDSGFYTDGLFEKLAIDKPSFIHACASVRKSEYLAGRHCARMALGGIGISDASVNKNLDQTPEWPENVSGSISHCNNHAVAAVAKKTSYALVGIDCESIIPPEVCDEIKHMVVGKNELEIISATTTNLRTGITLAISLKESFFKAVFPAYGVSMDFLDIEILGISADKQSFQIGCNQKLAGIIGKDNFHGRYMSLDADTLLTLLAA